MKKGDVVASQFNVTKSVRIDSEMANELDFIALYEKADPGTLLRMWSQDRILAYLQNPQYKRWKKQVEQQAAQMRLLKENMKH